MDSAFLGGKEKKNNNYYFTLGEKERGESVLLSNNTKRRKFVTNETAFYFDHRSEEDVKRAEFRKKYTLFDSLNYRIIENFEKNSGQRGLFLKRKYREIVRRINEEKLRLNESLSEKRNNFLESVSLVKLWNASMLTAVLIGMVTMSFVYRYLGQSAAAVDGGVNDTRGEIVSQQPKKEKPEEVWTKEREEEYVNRVTEYLEEKDNKKFAKKVKKMVKGYPIEKMLPYILKQDRLTAIFLIAIAKKESNWGKRVPVLNGKDCYNYWGYRGKRERMGSGGHTCFDSRRDAIDTVGKRLHKLIYDYGRNTPGSLVVWKCGNSCSTHSKSSVKKWISDVDLYFKKLR